MRHIRLIVVVLSAVALGCSGLQLATTPTPLPEGAETTPAEATASASATVPAPTTEVPSPSVTPTATAKPTDTPIAAQPEATATRPAPTAAPLPTSASTATPRPEDVAPVIVSFTADRTDIAENEAVTLQWEGRGALEASIWWFDKHAMPAPSPTISNPNGGTVVINPDAGPIHLTLRNAVGETEATIALTVRCAHAWAPALADKPPTTHCPFEAESGQGVYQPFERGFMLWFGPAREVYAFFNNGSYRVYTDNFVDGDPESDPAIVPPAGLYQPTRGFGLVWRSYADVRDGLGWATAPESLSSTWRQGWSGVGMHYVTYYVQLPGRILELDTFGARWKEYVP